MRRFRIPTVPRPVPATRVAAGLLALAPLLAPAQDLGPLARIGELSLEELGEVRVTSVSGRPEAARSAAASVFVITGEDIRRSGSTSLPEALRLAPNLQVARINATQYAISARGFNNSIGNKLLVLVDGRTVYSPLFSGVFWDAQDVMLEDVERIEVISGPGATLWGANAVNGVINVITRSALDTRGTLLSAQGGPEGSRLTARQGGRFGDRGGWRIYATRLARDDTPTSGGARLADGVARSQVGFRVDRDDGTWRSTLQGDAYHATGEATTVAPGLSGANLLARVGHRASDGATWQLQGYFDEARRRDAIVFRDHTQILDLAFDHSPAPIGRHRLLWGASRREARSDTGPAAAVRFDPQVRDLQWTSVFVQDEITLTDRLRVTVGAKAERNVYTGTELLPSLRAAWDVGDSGMLWGAVSRAVRAPARLDRDFFFPANPPFLIRGGAEFRSEIANVIELGWRGQSLPNFSYSVTAFHHDYDRLRAGRAGPTAVENLAYGRVWGVEAWGSVDLTRTWRLSGGLVELRKSLRAAPEAGPLSVENLGNDPEHQWMLRSSLTLPAGIEFDAMVRRVSALPFPAVPSYVATDLRLGRQLSPHWHASVAGRNLGARHVEFEPATGSLSRPSVWLRLEWRTP